MSKEDQVKIIDLPGKSQENGITPASLYRPADENAPPTPTGVSIVPKFGGIELNIDFRIDRAHSEADFAEFVVFRALALDNGDVGVNSQQVIRMKTDTATIAQEAGTVAFYSVLANDEAGNPSGFSAWVQGMSLRDNGLEDSFSTYGGDAQVVNDGGLNWLSLANFEEGEGFDISTPGPPGSIVTFEVDHAAQGATSLKWDASTGDFLSKYGKTGTFDFSSEGRFTNDDYMTLFMHFETISPGAVLQIIFQSDTFDFFSASITHADYNDGDNAYIKIKRSDFFPVGVPDWGNVIEYHIAFLAGSGDDVFYVDDWRMVKASPENPLTCSDTADLWEPLPYRHLSSNGGEWHIYDDVGVDAPFAIGQIKVSAETYLLIREDRKLEDARHSALFQARYADGKGGLLFRVTKPALLVDAPTLNGMFMDGTAKTISLTHTETEIGTPNFAQDSVSGSYVLLSSADRVEYAAVTLPNSDDEFTVHIAMAPNFAGVSSTSYVAWEHYIDASNNIALSIVWNGAEWAAQVTGQVAGTSYISANLVDFTWAPLVKSAFTVVVSGASAIVYRDSVIMSTATNAGGVYPATSATFYLGADNAGTNSYRGQYYQLVIEPEESTASEIEVWYKGFLVGNKLANPTQRSFYAYQIDTAANNLTLTKSRVGFDVEELSVPFVFVSDFDTIYYLTMRLTNNDSDGDGIIDEVTIQTYVSAKSTNTFKANNQTFSFLDAINPLLSGAVGFITEGANIRISSYQAGSPQSAHTADQATTAKGALGAFRIPHHVLFEELAGKPDQPIVGEGKLYIKDDGFIYFLADDDTEYNLTTAVGGAAVDEAFVTIGNSGTLPNERALTAGLALSLVDGGANSAATLAHIAGSNGDLHTNYAEYASAETITGAWQFDTNVVMAVGITIDGVDISVHAADADAHHVSFVGLEDNAGVAIVPAGDDRIQVTDDGVINADASGNALVLSIDQASIDHGSLAGLSDDDHPQYTEHATAESITQQWAFTSGLTIGTGGANGIIHEGDSDTFIRMANDAVIVEAGGKQLISATVLAGTGVVRFGTNLTTDSVWLNNIMFVNGLSGNVGIVGSSPQERLHISEAVAAGVVAARIENEDATGQADLVLRAGTVDARIRLYGETHTTPQQLQITAFDNIPIVFLTDASPTEKARIDGGILFVGDTVNTFQTAGITVKTTTNDEALALKSGVIHGVTAETEADTYLILKRAGNTSGGGLVDAYALTVRGLLLRGTATTTVTTETTGSLGAVVITGALKSGTARGDLGSDDNAIVLTNNLTTRVIVKGGGDVHQIGGNLFTGYAEKSNFIFSAYSTFEGTFGGTAISVTWSVEWRKDALYTHAADSVTVVIVNAGEYKITANITTDISSGSSNAETRAYILRNGTEIIGSSGYGYSRTAADGIATIPLFAIITAAASDAITVEVVRVSGSATMKLIANNSRISIERI